jgi:hypothetical protein
MTVQHITGNKEDVIVTKAGGTLKLKRLVMHMDISSSTPAVHAITGFHFSRGFGGSRRKAVAGNLRQVSETHCVAWADLPRLPAPRIAPAVEAGYHHNPIVLHFEEYAIREKPHSRTAMAPVDDRELQRMFCECLNRGLDRQRETLP